MIDKLELKSSHEVVDTVNVTEVDSIFQGKPTDPDILTVVMKDGTRLYCDEVCPVDSLQGEPASEDLEKAAEQDVCEVVNCCSATRIPNDHIPSWVQDAMVNEFIHGVQWQKEQLMKDATDVTVHVDAGGYPYIPQMELYDYDNDVPLAKEGDKYKVVLIKED